MHPTLSGALRPFLEFIDGYRRRNAAPVDTIIRKKYSKYADLDYIKKRLQQVENDVYGEYWEGERRPSRNGI